MGEVIRVSASEIHIQWAPFSDDATEVLTYLVKHRPIRPTQNIQKRNTDDLSVIVETNQTSSVISDLDPRLSYAVSVAVSNEGGAGNFSEEIVIGCELWNMSLQSLIQTFKMWAILKIETFQLCIHAH